MHVDEGPVVEGHGTAGFQLEVQVDGSEGTLVVALVEESRRVLKVVTVHQKPANEYYCHWTNFLKNQCEQQLTHKNHLPTQITSLATISQTGQ